jgi:hypothetical protein
MQFIYIYIKHSKSLREKLLELHSIFACIRVCAKYSITQYASISDMTYTVGTCTCVRGMEGGANGPL